MSDLSQTLTKGTLLMIETGSFSDYSCDDPVRLSRDFLKADLVNDFVASDPPKTPQGVILSSGFLAWLVATRRATPVENIHRWDIGEHSRFTP